MVFSVLRDIQGFEYMKLLGKAWGVVLRSCLKEWCNRWLKARWCSGSSLHWSIREKPVTTSLLLKFRIPAAFAQTLLSTVRHRQVTYHRLHFWLHWFSSFEQPFLHWKHSATVHEVIIVAPPGFYALWRSLNAYEILFGDYINLDVNTKIFCLIYLQVSHIRPL